MLPTLQVGPWQVSTYILTYVLAALAADLFSFLRLKRLGVAPVILLRATLLVTVAGFACAYLVRLIPTIQRYFLTGTWDWVGGNSYIGGLLGGIGVLILICRRQRIPVSRALDQVLPTLALAQAIGRLGCFAAGCCYGRATDSWLGLYLPDHQGDWAVRYPTQLFSAAADLLILALLLALETRFLQRNRASRAFDGVLALLYVGLYCLERFLVEFLRADALPALGPVSWAQLYTGAGLALVTLLLVWKTTRPVERPWRRRREVQTRKQRA